MGNQPVMPKSSLMDAAMRITRDYWPVITAAILFAAAQFHAFANWIAVWNEKDSYYSHGFLVPFIAAIMVWIHRNKLAKTPISHSWVGLLLLFAFVPVHVIGYLMGLRVLYGVAFFMGLYGSILLLFGQRITKIVFVPVLFLLTMIPVASWVLDNATGRFQLISATVATKFLQLTTLTDITQYGNLIKSTSLPGDGTLLVGSPCSGLRLLISLITFSWFFVYVVQGTWWRKAILLGLSFPLSIFVNSLRITMIGWVGLLTDSSSAMHTFHNYSGYIGLAVCFVILFGIAKLIRIGELQIGEPISSTGVPIKGASKPVGGVVPGVAVAVLLAISAVMTMFVSPLYNLPKGHIDRESIPMSFGNWTGHELEIDDTTRGLLSKGDLMSIMYLDAATGRQVHVFIDASLDISAFHDPHLCLPGGGSPITEDRVIDISFKEPRPITVKSTVLESSSDYGTNMVAYWYMSGATSYPRTENLAQINRKNKLSDLASLVRRPFELSGLRRDINSRQFLWYRFSTEKYDDGQDQEFLRSFMKDFVANIDSFGK